MTFGQKGNGIGKNRTRNWDRKENPTVLEQVQFLSIAGDP